MTSDGGRLSPDGTRVRLLETRAACCRPSNSQLGGQPCPSLAHSLSEWMSTKRRLPWHLSPTSMAPRSSPWAPLGHASVTSITSSGRCHRKPNTSDDPGQQLESPRQALPTLPTPGGTRQPCERRHRRHCPCTRGMHVGHGQTASSNSVSAKA
jgi:hypothetical protein